MTFKHPVRVVVLAVALSLSTAAAMARSTELVQPPHAAITTPNPVTTKQVRDAIIAGGSHHGWKPVADAPGLLTLMASSGQHTVTVDVPYDEHGFQVKFKSSTNMNQGGSGDRITIHPHVNRWLSDLDSDITAAIQSAAIQAH